jgi:hypothetical protein
VATQGILADGAAAAWSFFFVPLLAAGFGVPAAIWGLALGHVVLRLRRRVESPPGLFIAALAAAATVPLAVAYEIWRRI